jgi:hypothetical protein|tara:strand:- start:4714 stop:4869 length:156 start_codon:yes stop_codon:yes gene_type:complete
MNQKRILVDFLTQHQQREKKLLSKILECFLEHKRDTLEDLKVLKHNREIDY